MGWRAIRVSFDRPALLRQQLRALIRAAGRPGPLRHVPDDRRGGRVPLRPAAARSRDRARGQRRQARCRARSRWGRCWRCRRCSISSIMLLREVDFLSVGTNDLFQFLFASDRGNYRISERYDVLSPVLLGLLRLDRRARCGQAGVAGQPVRRNGRPAARCDGADRPRLPHLVDVAAGAWGRSR